MTDLPKNELFSAYLDGELSAAEQAEMDRLLAASPAARQLLDELRTLSTTLQSLPQEELGVDLSEGVLRVAAKRRLAEPATIFPSPVGRGAGGGGVAASSLDSGQQQSTAVPWTRTIFRPFRNRRAMAWLAITAVIAVIIAINEHQQGMRPDATAVKARVLARSAETLEKPVAPPTMQAPADQDLSSSKPAAALGEKASESSRRAASPATTPAESPKGRAAPMRAKGGEAAGKPAEGFRAAKKGFARSLERVESDKKLDGYGGQAGVAAEPAASSTLAYRNVLVVRCNITPKAVQKQALEKLLIANGIVPGERRDSDRSSDALTRQLTEEAKQMVVREGESQPAVERNEKTVSVEATPEQIEATLAGLKAQPEVFLSFSVEPPLTPTNAPASMATNMAKTEAASNAQPMTPNAAPSNAFQFQQRTNVTGPEMGRGAVGQLDMNVRQNVAHVVARQRVLFVLKVVEARRPPAAKAGTPVESAVIKPANAAPASQAAPDK